MGIQEESSRQRGRTMHVGETAKQQAYMAEASEPGRAIGDKVEVLEVFIPDSIL